MGKTQQDRGPTCMAGWVSSLQQNLLHMGRVGMLWHHFARSRITESVLELQGLYEACDAEALAANQVVEMEW